MPVSSSIVKNASNAGWAIVVLERTAMIAATPMPLSAPKVVPFAFTQSASMNISMPCCSKSKTVLAFFWCTMSRCDCKITVWRLSIPEVAGFLIMTFPALSTSVSRPRPSPKAFMKAMIRASFLEGRGTALSAAKCCQSA